MISRSMINVYVSELIFPIGPVDQGLGPLVWTDHRNGKLPEGGKDNTALVKVLLTIFLLWDTNT